MEISNKTKRPLRIPLPGGKKLHLGPSGSGQVSPKALDHPPLKKLIEHGQIEVTGGGRDTKGGNPGGSGGIDPSKGSGPSGSSMRHTGDR